MEAEAERGQSRLNLPPSPPPALAATALVQCFTCVHSFTWKGTLVLAISAGAPAQARSKHTDASRGLG